MFNNVGRFWWHSRFHIEFLPLTDWWVPSTISRVSHHHSGNLIFKNIIWFWLFLLSEISHRLFICQGSIEIRKKFLKFVCCMVYGRYVRAPIVDRQDAYFIVRIIHSTFPKKQWCLAVLNETCDITSVSQYAQIPFNWQNDKMTKAQIDLQFKTKPKHQRHVCFVRAILLLDKVSFR